MGRFAVGFNKKEQNSAIIIRNDKRKNLFLNEAYCRLKNVESFVDITVDERHDMAYAERTKGTFSQGLQ